MGECCHHFGAATSVAKSILKSIEADHRHGKQKSIYLELRLQSRVQHKSSYRLTIAMDYKSPSTWGCDFSRGIVSVSIKLAIEMESESPSTICAGLKPSTSLGFGFHLAMANLPAKFKNTVRFSSFFHPPFLHPQSASYDFAYKGKSLFRISLYRE